MHHERRVHPGQKDGERNQSALDKPHQQHSTDYGRPRLKGMDEIPKCWWWADGPWPGLTPTSAFSSVSKVEVHPWGTFIYFSDPDGNTWSVQQIPRRE